MFAASLLEHISQFLKRKPLMQDVTLLYRCRPVVKTLASVPVFMPVVSGCISVCHSHSTISSC